MKPISAMIGGVIGGLIARSVVHPQPPRQNRLGPPEEPHFLSTYGQKTISWPGFAIGLVGTAGILGAFGVAYLAERLQKPPKK